MEGFFDDLGKFAAKAAPTVLPLAGQVVGGIYGGPAGAAIGGSLGSLAGGTISNLAGGGKPASAGYPAAPTPSTLSSAGPVAAPPSALGGSPAAGQLLQTITRPETLQALASMMMGAMGKQNVSVGGTQVPVTAFTNLIGSLAGRTEAEFSARSALQEGNVPHYLQDYAGEAKGDPANPEHRAEALYELLEASEVAGESSESGEWAESFESYGESEAVESEAEAAEFLELALESLESEDI
jgi:hypothetical protein